MESKTKDSSYEPIDNAEQKYEVDLQFLKGTVGDGDKQDGRYGWVILCASCYAQFIMSINASYGVLYIEFLDYFERGKAETSLPGAIAFGVMVCGAPVASVICNYLGHRLALMIGSVLTTTGLIISAFATKFGLLYFSYSLLFGFGLCLHGIPSLAMISFYFKKRRKLAMGLAMSGAGIGYLVFPLLMQFLIEHLSWRGAMIVLACASLQSCVTGSLFRPKNHMRETPRRCDSEIFTEWPLYTLGAVFFFEGVGHSVIVAISPDRTLTLGCTPEQAALLVSIQGIGSLTGGVLSSIIANFLKIRIVVIFSIAIGLKFITHLVLAIGVRNFGILASAYLHYGLMHGSALSIHGLYLIEVFGVEKFTNAYGNLLPAVGVGAMIGPPVAGAIYEVSGSFTPAFSILTGVSILSSLLNLPIYIHKKKMAKNNT